MFPQAETLQLGRGKHNYLTYETGLSQGFCDFYAREIAVISLVAMIKVLAQMKYLRKGHDSQGRLKKIRINQAYESYANYMAPMRVEEIRREAKKNATSVEILKPETVTYLTPEWDEMVPFPRSK